MADAVLNCVSLEAQELRHLSRSLAEKTIVSTVDRYQGDENDVVILSLVRTRPGNRFVALKNRFIVAASRARIGFYILGSVGAVVGRAGAASQHSGPPHWRGLLENLNRAHNSKDEEEAAGDKVAVRATDEAVAAGSQAAQPTSAMFMGPRTGGSLPICCPQHAAVQRRIVQSSAFPEESTWDTFCSQTCGQALPWCGHQCGLSCHAPKPNLHKPPSECPQLLERPCEEHRHIPLSCGDLYRSMVESGSRWLHQAPGKALQSYKCKEIVDFQRPECDHSVKIPCHQHKKVVASLEVLPPCETKASVAPSLIRLSWACLSVANADSCAVADRGPSPGG